MLSSNGTDAYHGLFSTLPERRGGEGRLGWLGPVATLPRLVLHLAREDRGDESEDEQRDLQLARLHEQLHRGVARDESRHVRHDHADRRRREHVERELLLLRLDEARELRRDLAEGEDLSPTMASATVNSPQ